MSDRERRRPSERLPKSQGVKYYSSAKSGPESTKSPFKLLPGGRGRVFGRVIDFGILLAVLAVAILLLIVRSPAEVTTDSEIYNSQETYSEAIQGYLNSPAYKNKVTFSEDELETKVKSQFPEVAELKVKLPILSANPKVALSIHSPSILLSGQGKSLIIDSQGRAVGSSNVFSDAGSLIAVIDDSGFELNEGEVVLSRSSVEFIQTLSEHLDKAKIPVESISLPAKPQELVLKTKDQGYLVKFYLGGNPEIQIGQFLAARQHFKDENITPSQYLDARVSGRIFYK